MNRFRVRKFWICQVCFGVGGILAALTVIKAFDIKILASFPPVLGIIGLGLIALGAAFSTNRREKEKK